MSTTRKACAVLALALIFVAGACSPAGSGSGMTGLAGTPIQNSQCWTLGDSRAKGSTMAPTFVGWGSYLIHLGCKNLSESGTGWEHTGIDGTTIPEVFAASVKLRGIPAKVYISASANDALQNTDASATIRAFHDQLDALGVQQIWATTPYTTGGTPQLDATNALIAKMNRAETWAKDCAGPNPANPADMVDAVHQSTAFNEAFALCIAS